MEGADESTVLWRQPTCLSVSRLCQHSFLQYLVVDYVKRESFSALRDFFSKSCESLIYGQILTVNVNWRNRLILWNRPLLNM